MFISEHFTFNGVYSKDMNVAIVTTDKNMFHDIGVEYVSNVEVETDSIDYNPYFTEKTSQPSDIELLLAFYDNGTMTPLNVDVIDMEKVYNWLLTDDFAPFISDDDEELIYYFKVVNIKKVLTFNKEGYLSVTFKPYSKYVYKRETYEIDVTDSTTLEIENPSRVDFYPIIKVTNNGNKTTINKINDMEIVGLANGETIIIDNLMKLVQSEEGLNKFNCCNRCWIKLNKREANTLTLSGNCKIEIIAEFPLLR